MGDACCTCVFDACKYQHVECVRLLLDEGADVDARDENGRTVLHWACCFEDTECARLTDLTGLQP